MNSTEKKLVSVFTLLGSLASYYYGKTNSKDSIPYVMIGGFVGAWVGEILSKAWEESKKNKNDGSNN
ncbi:MAG: hypothetical protein Q8T03_12100 [Bacteroidota bacterium]|jgi:uncharacterized membrane protein YeaQ/YmgE (transglycosylase-associated protein family)|nr:hypothetical protein [Bacteroidota bacterium]